MAIAFDNSLARQNGAGTTLTTSFTITGASTALVVFADHNTGSTVTCTYGGVSMTKIHDAVSNNAQLLSSFILVGTATGANDIVMTRTGGSDMSYQAMSYTGVGTGGSTGGSDSSAQLIWASGGGNRTLATTTVANNSWITLFHRTADEYTAGTNVTFRQSTSGVAVVSDTNGAITPAGSTNQTINIVSGTGGGGMLSISLAPPASATHRGFFGFMGM